MCSILGYFSPKKVRALDQNGLDILNKLIKLNIHRGGNGAGIWTEKSGLVKSVHLNLPHELLKRKGKEKNLLMHLRIATNGGICDRFCHPFVLDDIAYCHNGHISNFTEFGAEMDSLAGLFAINKGQKAIEKLTGWYVFAWYDKKRATINLLNHNGSIQYGWYRGNLVFASEGLDKVLEKWFVVPDNKWLVFKAYRRGVRIVESKTIKPKETHVQRVIDFSDDFGRFGLDKRDYWNDETVAEMIENNNERLNLRGI